MRKSLYSAGALLSLGALVLSGCTPNTANNASGTSADGSITVTASDTECKVGATEVKAGKVTFKITNNGTKVNEFYVLAKDGLRIISEIENIAPGLSRDLTVELAEGEYTTACKPGMVGDGIRGSFKVTANPDAKPVAADEQALRDQAVTQYTAYVKDQTEQLVTKTEAFAQLVIDGKDEEARKAYAPARLHYERIEPVAESFGDLDPALDAREADLEQGEEWTGWHKLEKDLWKPTAADNDGKEYTALTKDERKKLAEKLVEDTKKLNDEVHASDFKLDVSAIANGSKSLLDEVVKTKISGEEEAWSHTDLMDFQGNIEGARVAFEDVRPLLEKKNPDLAKELDKKFNAVETELAKYKSGESYKFYNELSKDQVRALSDSVDALSEPLSKLADAVLS